ncbi:MAG: DUF4065 domain-containing protein [Anaeroplasmataceae bacterium]|nr:DUF4065 domain-containing protein [Anaeroplasmataceae bacterium]
MKTYCVHCEKEVNVCVEEKEFELCLENKELKYLGKVAKCASCGEEILIDEVEDYNQQEFEKAYKEANSIIDVSEIKEIIDMYRIGKRPLSIVLELGELTMTRYLDGYIPSPKNSEFLKKIKKNPEEYYNLLNKNKDKITAVAYKKSKHAVEKLLNINENDPLLEDVAEYILMHNLETTPLVLQKLLYYVEVLYSMFYGKPLFKSECRAWTHGPVYARIYYIFKDFGKDPITLEEYNNRLSSELISLVDSVIKCFGCYSGNVLSFFTHKEEPWKNARENELECIDKNEILDFALEIKKNYKIEKETDFHFYSDAMFKKYQEFCML